MANYIDGFVFPVPKDHLVQYTKVAKKVADIWKEHGALSYHEYLGDDLKLEGTTEFPELISAKSDEVVIFGWVVFDSRETRDLANKLVAADSRMPELVNPITQGSRVIFDGSRMAYGGFRAIV